MICSEETAIWLVRPRTYSREALIIGFACLLFGPGNRSLYRAGGFLCVSHKILRNHLENGKRTRASGQGKLNDVNAFELLRVLYSVQFVGLPFEYWGNSSFSIQINFI